MISNAWIIFGILGIHSALISCDLISLQTLPSKREAVGGIQIGKRFYFAGGFEFNDNVPSSTVDIYNIESRQWEEPIHLDEPRAWISTSFVGENIYFVGGARYEGDCTMVYNATLHQYEGIGCGPTVRQAIQVSNHNSTVTVLGSFSADFYNQSNGWYNKPDLTSWMLTISGGIKFVHENLIIGIGGVNTTTLEQLNDAWIYDTDLDQLTVYYNVTSTPLDLSNTTFDFSVQNQKVVIFTADRYFAHELGSTQWFEYFMPGIYQAVPLTDVAFMFNSSGYTMYYWGTNLVTWTANSVINWVMAFDNQVAMIENTYIQVYQDGVWTDAALGILPDIIVKMTSDQYLLYSSTYYIFFYNSTTKQVSTQQKGIFSISTIIRLDDHTVALFFPNRMGGIYDVAAKNLELASYVIRAEYAVGGDIISIKDQMVLVNLNSTISRVLVNPNLRSKDNSVITVSPSLQAYLYIDVFNLTTKQRQRPPVFMNSVGSVGSYFLSVAVIEDMLIVMTNSSVFRYNTTSGGSVRGASNPKLTAFSTVCPVPVYDRVARLPGSYPSAIISVGIKTVSLVDNDDIQNFNTSQFVAVDNILYITAKASKFEQIFTFDINSQSLQTFSLPVTQDQLTIAITNNTLVALGSDGYIYAMKLDDYSTWYRVPFERNVVPTIAQGMDNGTIMIFGSTPNTLGVYSDQILFINASAIIDTGTKIVVSNNPISPPSSVIIVAPIDELQQGLSMGQLVPAIVVPVVVVVAGAIALIVILVQRRRQRNSTTSSVGLESRYGAWFTPFDQITFGEQLGQGGSGQVFKGKWKNTSVALKVSMTQANNSVITELELMMQLRPHPNVVQLFGFSVHPETNSIILIIEFCEGGSLDTKLYDRQEDVSLQTKLQWLTGIAKGLSHLHSNNIVHRDIAARNVLVHRNEPKLTDFGMSRVVDDQQQRGTTKSELGPIRWMSPESLKNKEYSTKSDIWSFGILMFEVVARQEPHSEADPIEVGRLIRDEGWTPVSPSSCHPQLADVMKQCWQMSPQSRPKIESIIESLESIQTK